MEKVSGDEMTGKTEKISMEWLQGMIGACYGNYSEEMAIGARAFLNDLRNLHLIREERIEWDYEGEDDEDEDEDLECRMDRISKVNGGELTTCSKHPGCENSLATFQKQLALPGSLL